MAIDNSVSEWILGLKGGDAYAVQELWNRFSVRLTALAKQRLGDLPRRIGDEEDVAQSVFSCLWRSAQAGRLENVTNRDDLWWLLIAITRRKVVDHVRREMAKKRGAGRVLSESAFPASRRDGSDFTLDLLIGDAPTPEFVLELGEQHDRLMGLLRDDRTRRVASARIEGYSVQEIAAELSVSPRTIERKIQIIRSRWGDDLGRGADPAGA